MSADEPILTFPEGLPGFPDTRRFVLTEFSGDGVFQLLTSLDRPDLSMVVMVPWLAFPDYGPEIGETDRVDLGIEDPSDAVVFCAVTADEEQLYVNLLGPFVVNRHTRVGRQLVLADQDLPVRAPLHAGA